MSPATEMEQIVQSTLHSVVTTAKFVGALKDSKAAVLRDQVDLVSNQDKSPGEVAKGIVFGHTSKHVLKKHVIEEIVKEMIDAKFASRD